MNSGPKIPIVLSFNLSSWADKYKVFKKERCFGLLSTNTKRHPAELLCCAKQNGYQAGHTLQTWLGSTVPQGRWLKAPYKITGEYKSIWMQGWKLASVFKLESDSQGLFSLAPELAGPWATCSSAQQIQRVLPLRKGCFSQLWFCLSPALLKALPAAFLQSWIDSEIFLPCHIPRVATLQLLNTVTIHSNYPLRCNSWHL